MDVRLKTLPSKTHTKEIGATRRHRKVSKQWNFERHQASEKKLQRVFVYFIRKKKDD